MKMKLIVALVAIGACLSSCSTKTSAINDLRSLSEEIETKGSTYTTEDWNEVKEKYEKINTNLAKHEYTAEENLEIGRLKGQCVANFAKGVATNVKDKVVNAASQVKGIIDGIKSVFNEDSDSSK